MFVCSVVSHEFRLRWMGCLVGLFLRFDDFFGWKWILFTRFGMLQFGCIEILNSIDEVQLLLLLFDGCSDDQKTKTKKLEIQSNGIA